MTANSSNRWLIAVAGVVMQLALGAVYAWSVFRIPLTKSYGWTVSQATLAFELAILLLGFAAFAGGLWMKRSGPRRVAAIGGLCYGLGLVLAGQVGGHLRLLYLSYGVLGDIGLGPSRTPCGDVASGGPRPKYFFIPKIKSARPASVLRKR
jgi:OFA family oxalate/formate antiporter-like MFS transporter